MASHKVLLQVDARGVATLTLNRPEVHNAFDDEVIAVLTGHLHHLAGDESVRVLVLNSNGKHFSAGADLGWMQRMADLTYEENMADAAGLAQLMSSLDNFPTPVLTIVQGAAYAGALGLLCCADYTLASTRATFCVSEVKLGLSPAVISPYVVRTMGARNARRYCLSAEVFDASEARRIGIVHEVAAEEGLTEVAAGVVGNWLNMGPNALKATKQLIRRVGATSIDADTILYTQALIAGIRVSAEGQEGLRAFFAKRAPGWQG